MIDDDTFEKFFREMMEEFFGRLGISPGPHIIDESESDFQDEISQSDLLEVEDQNLPVVERFDFDDHVLFAVQGCANESEITVRVKGKLVILNMSSGYETMYELPFVVDAEESSISCRNGIAEIIIRRNHSENIDNIERVLRFE
jgi:HSP20 family molecular chaperone IbpA